MSCDTASVIINKPARDVFAFMADPHKLDLWSFGTWNTEIDANNLVHGRSMFDGSSVFVHIETHAKQWLIDYHVGNTADSLVPRIYARIAPGRHFSDNNDSSLLMLTALRGNTMDNSRWSGLVAAHAVEIKLIKTLIESGYDHRLAATPSADD